MPNKLYVVEETGGDWDGYWKHIYLVTLSYSKAKQIKKQLNEKAKEIVSKAPKESDNWEDDNNEYWDYRNKNGNEHYMDNYAVEVKVYELDKPYDWYSGVMIENKVQQ